MRQRACQTIGDVIAKFACNCATCNLQPATCNLQPVKSEQGFLAHLGSRAVFREGDRSRSPAVTAVTAVTAVHPKLADRRR
jgi:hypothetical protein